MSTSGWKGFVAVCLLAVSGAASAVPTGKPDPAGEIHALIAALGNSDVRKREAASATLERIVLEGREKARAVDALKQAAASSPDLEIRAQAAVILRRAGLGADRREVESLLAAMKKARDLDAAAEAYDRIVVLGRAGTEALEREFAADPERYGARERLYRLEVVLASGKKGPILPEEDALVTATLTNRGEVGVWISPMTATLEVSLDQGDGKRISLGRQLPDGVGETLFERGFAGRAGACSLLHLAPGESYTLAFGVSSRGAGTLSCAFDYAAAEREAQAGNLERVRLLAKSMGGEIPEQIAWPTPFKTIGADLEIPVAGRPAGEEGKKPLFPSGQKAPFEE